jgi:methylated-DNA-[protein]-cysteine S-methyltransferase
MGFNYALFDTAIGTCGIVWGKSGIVGLALPAAGDGELAGHLSRRFPEAGLAEPQSGAAAAIEGIRALLRGEKRDLLEVQLDMQRVPEFHQRVYEVTRRVLPGQTITYGEISARLKAPGTARAVGHALGSNPFPVVVPCHRVLGASGKTGGFSAPGGIDAKLQMLNIEQQHDTREPSLFVALPLAAAPRRSRGEPPRRR